MSQKSILSFFKSADQTNSSNQTKKKQVIEDSPVKATRSKRKVQCIESDDEHTDSPVKLLNGQSSQTNEDTKNKKTKLSNQKSPRVSPKEKKKKQVNGISGSKKSPKQKKIEEEEKMSSEFDSKDETDKSDDQQKLLDNKSEDSLSKASVSLDNSHIECVPKRKTARKQINSARKAKNNSTVSKGKEESNSKTHEDAEEIKKDIASNDSTASQSEQLDIEMKETEISLSDSAMKESSSCNEADSDKESKSKQLSRDTEKSPGVNRKGKSVKGKKTPLKKSTKVKNIEHDSTVSQSEQLDIEMKETETSLSDSAVKESSSCNEADSEKESKSKHLSLDTEKSPVVNRKGKSVKGKKTPLKKSTKVENIHNFFMPMKKSEDKNEEKTVNEDIKNEKSNDLNKTKTKSKEKSEKSNDNKKSKKNDHDDSPVKRVTKRKKKIQSLESDDENEDKSLGEHVKVETDDAQENSDSSSEKNKENSSTDKNTNSDSSSEKNKENSTDKNTPRGSNSKEKESPCKKSEDADTKSTKEKTKLSVKSTSASGIVYNPSKSQYHPINDACWKKDEKVPYLALAKTLELIENTSGRLKTIEFLSNFFRSVIVLSPDDLLHSVYLCLNRLAPEYEGIELGVGETLLMKAVAQATGRSLDKIKAEVAAKGDLGLVSESSRGNQRVMFAPPKLTVSSVFSKFFEIAKMSGNSAMAKKTDKIQSLFVACRECEARYIIRSLSGKLRIGLAEQSVLNAITRAAVQTPPAQEYPPEIIDTSKKMSSESFKELVDSQALILKTAYCECPSYDLIIPVLLKEGISALPDRCQLSPGRPLKPMLAHPTAGIDKVLERFDKNAFTCEFKYDGERAQIHMTDKGDIKIFSRNQEDNTSKYPDIISRFSKALKETTKTFILDSEAVAWDKASKQILPFQVLSTRKRKDAVESEIVVQVCIMAFDLLYLNGESLVKKSLKERRSLLHSSFQEVENEFMFAHYKDGNSAETMQEFLDESVKGNCEGLMVKSLEVDASYEIAKRSHNWLKLKKDYLQGVGDTLDLVVIGGYYGKGKRTGNYGGFLLACYDEENEEYQSICKLGTGFKDNELEAHTTFLKQHVIKDPKSYFRYDHGLEPDEWFEPVQVWEIKCADLSISPIHKAAIGIVDPEKGISLRFPRFIRVRDDKTPENATNSEQIAKMYREQQQIQNTTNKSSKTEEDYY